MRPSAVAKAVAREPLVHFLVLGALCFWLYRPSEPRAADDERRIVVSAGRVEQLIAIFTRTWMRPPTPDELRGLVRDHLLEEVAYRDALAMGLDRDDAIIRRRLRQKLDFLLEDEADLLEPSDQVLAAFLAEHAERFQDPPRLSFRQVTISRDRHGDETEAVARRLLDALSAGEDVPGDATLLPSALERATPAEIAAQLGADFAAALEDLAVGRWELVRSAFGLHAVRVSERLPARLPALAEIRRDVEREWEGAMRRERKQRREAENLARFDVVVEWPSADPGTE